MNYGPYQKNKWQDYLKSSFWSITKGTTQS